MPWFSITALFKHTRKGTNFVPQYEERVCIVQAKNIKKAEKKFINDFKKYLNNNEQFLNIYEISEVIEGIGNKPVEIASSCRVSDLSASKYINKYWYGLKPKNCKKLGWKHHWYNKDNIVRGCYNCMKTKKIKG